MKEFTTARELKDYLESVTISDYDKKILIDYFNENNGLADDCFYLASEEEVTDLLIEEMKDETLVYFNADFLSGFTELDIESIQAIQSLENNDLMVKLFNDDIEDIALEALSLDGVGHFFNHYDGSNEEAFINDNLYYTWFN